MESTKAGSERTLHSFCLKFQHGSLEPAVSVWRSGLEAELETAEGLIKHVARPGSSPGILISPFLPKLPARQPSCGSFSCSPAHENHSSQLPGADAGLFSSSLLVRCYERDIL